MFRPVQAWPNYKSKYPKRDPSLVQLTLVLRDCTYGIAERLRAQGITTLRHLQQASQQSLEAAGLDEYERFAVNAALAKYTRKGQ
jgi:hypothetical protein